MAKGVFLKKNGERYYPAPYMPIGSIYLTVSNDNPSKWFGGTWEKMSGGYLYACINSIGNSSYTGSSTQGHRLTAKESGLPNHQHSIEPYGGWGAWGSGSHTGMINQMGANKFNQYYANWCGEKDAEYEHSHNIAYIGVWCWKRIA